MTREEFLKGWALLIAQPWGSRYAGDTDVAHLQAEFYYSAFQDLPARDWIKVATYAASRTAWPSVSELAEWLGRESDPGPEEAWGIVASLLQSESASACLTEDMHDGFCAAWPLREDPIAARMTFREVYTKKVAARKAQGLPPRWMVLPGRDHEATARARAEALARNRQLLQKGPDHVHPQLDHSRGAAQP